MNLRVGKGRAVANMRPVRSLIPLRHILFWLLVVTFLAMGGLLSFLIQGLLKSEELDRQAELATRALLVRERARDALDRPEIPDLPGRQELELALVRGDENEKRRALERYQNDALLILLQVQHTRAREQSVAALVSGLLALTCAACLAALLLMFRQRILAPIADLNRLARNVLDGDLGCRAPDFRQPEFALLGESMNAMLDGLEGRVQELEAARSELAELLAAGPAALLQVDRQGRVLAANAAAQELVGCELEGRAAPEVLPLVDEKGDSFWESAGHDPIPHWLLEEVPVAAARVDLGDESTLVQVRELRRASSRPSSEDEQPDPPETEKPVPADFEALTGREQEIFNEIAHGRTNKEIAENLFISEGTVKTHVNNMLRKLELRDRVQLLLYAARNNLLPQDAPPPNDPP
jgi:DNA-binding CsgD family transcriptional regulator/PAS domain-containing protein